MNLRFLRPLYDTPGPWATVYLDDSLGAERGRADVGLRWRALREALLRQGAAEPMVAAVEEAVRVTPPENGQHGLAVFANAGERVRDDPGVQAGPDLVHTEVMAAPPPADSAEYGVLPHVAPLLAQRGQRISWLRVVVDPASGSIESADSSSIDVSGSEIQPIRKIVSGGRSDRLDHAQDVAAELTGLADTMGPEVIIVAGDAEAGRLLIQQLPPRWRSKTVLTDVDAPGPEDDPTALDAVTAQVVAQTARQHADGVLHRLQGDDGDAVIGIAPVLAAFNLSQVETLLLDPIGLAGTVLWLDPASGQLAHDQADLPGDGTSARQVLAEDALIRAAATADADLLMVTAAGTDRSPLDLVDGVGAVLRPQPAHDRRVTEAV
ncbi:hypothetical protein AB0M47_24155 [Hamadaea sp. NPDC051192]|uniref:baeRF2 domain-containing protein n=1 Tax=Hamadaea sp. NPDC051192 TaxID=3154940 RepID=UPI00344A982D